MLCKKLTENADLLVSIFNVLLGHTIISCNVLKTKSKGSYHRSLSNSGKCTWILNFQLVTVSEITLEAPKGVYLDHTPLSIHELIYYHLSRQTWAPIIINQVSALKYLRGFYLSQMILIQGTLKLINCESCIFSPCWVKMNINTLLMGH